MVGIDVLGGMPGVPVDPPLRNGVSSVTGKRPTIVSISDIHGYLRPARSALLTLADHPEYDSVVEAGRLGELQWAGGERFVLVFNGDLIDRGPHNAAVVEMVERLATQAPPGHVRVTLGNHEMGVLTPDLFDWGDWYSTARTDEQRRAFAGSVRDGHVVAAYEGYNVIYAHAGRPQPYEPAALNDAFAGAVGEFEAAIGEPADPDRQERLVEGVPRVFGVDGPTGRGPEAGVAWLDFEWLPADAPPQVVGHTRQDSPVQRGNVVCGNVIRNNRRRDGGEAVVVETPERLVALRRRADGGVSETPFELP